MKGAEKVRRGEMRRNNKEWRERGGETDVFKGHCSIFFPGCLALSPCSIKIEIDEVTDAVFIVLLFAYHMEPEN